jgi:hypothetical protein
MVRAALDGETHEELERALIGIYGKQKTLMQLIDKHGVV